MYDFHVHNVFSGDAQMTTASAIAKARELGLKIICFTPHFEPVDFEKGKGEYFPTLFPDQVGEYLDEARNASGKGLEVLAGVEVEFTDGLEHKIEKCLDEFDFDFVLGSCHRGVFPAVDVTWRGTAPVFFESKSFSQAAGEYFAKVFRMIESGLFDSAAHLDVIRKYAVEKYGSCPFSAYEKPAEKAAQLLADNGMGLEINTSGLRRPDLNDFYPCRELVALCAKAGVKTVTVGSDAHRAEDVGFRIGDAVRLAQQSGFRSISVFERRKEKRIPANEALGPSKAAVE